MPPRRIRIFCSWHVRRHLYRRLTVHFRHRVPSSVPASLGTFCNSDECVRCAGFVSFPSLAAPFVHLYSRLPVLRNAVRGRAGAAPFLLFTDLSRGRTFFLLPPIPSNERGVSVQR